MGTPFIGEVKLAGFNFPPKGWAECNGQLLAINQNQALFSILGTTYGGNGTTNFALPNLQTRTPIGWGNGQGLPAVTIGQSSGEAAHTLTIGEMAAHTHTPNGSSASGPQEPTAPGGSLLGVSGGGNASYSQTSPNTTLVSGTVGMSPGGQPHNNMQPYQVVNFIIALTGIFPSRS